MTVDESSPGGEPPSELAGLTMMVRLADLQLPHGPAKVLLPKAGQQARDALSDLRDLVRGIDPQVLVDHGLPAAVDERASRAGVPLTVHMTLSRRPLSTVELSAYFVIAEALTNVTEHAKASGATVPARSSGDTLVVDVADDGQRSAAGGAATSTAPLPHTAYRPRPPAGPVRTRWVRPRLPPPPGRRLQQPGPDVGNGGRSVVGQHGGMTAGRSWDASTPVTDSPIDWVARHVRRYLQTGGRDGHRRYGHDCLLLTTRGRVTGRPRRTALFYWRDGDQYLVVPSNGGVPAFPDWYLNLRADSRVVVQLGSEVFVADARTATAAEWPRLWNVVITGLPRYARYAEKAGRDLPVVVLRPQ